MRVFRYLAIIVASAPLCGCLSMGTNPMAQGLGASLVQDGPGEHGLLQFGRAEIPRNLPKSKRGNTPTYEVFGKRYKVMDSALGYHEQGEASWYGSKFHGRETSSGETYDMYNMTAAHRHLPLPTFVEVTNLNNGKRVVVKVNDRGPFHPDRIIDLSYAAATKLGMLESGTATVEVVAISTHETADVGAESGSATTAVDATQIIQVGAFRDQSNAELMRVRVNQAMQVDAAYIVPIPEYNLFKVRFGVAPNIELPDVYAQLETHGIENYRIVQD